MTSGDSRPTRRAALLATAATPLSRPSGPDWGGLSVVTRGPMRDDERGGTTVILLHGWGAPGDDLVSLADELAAPGTRFLFPAAPLVERGGGRAWWHLDARDRPAHAWNDQEVATHQPNAQVVAARTAIQTVLRTARARFQPKAIVLGGFSQGAMLSLDVALAAAPAVEKVVALSGVLLADSLPALKAPRTPRTPAFVSHGRRDEVLPFRAGDSAKSLLERHGHAVTWRPFDGGHEIPRAVLADLRKFLAG